MRLPGTRYQEPGWEQVRKLLGACSLEVFAGGTLAALMAAPADQSLGLYVELLAERLVRVRHGARALAPGNSYGESVFELAAGLVAELAARPADWDALRAALGPACASPGSDALLRKKVNDMFAVLRDKVDADNYQAACGRPCSPNRIYAYRMLDTAYGEIARLFAAWREHRAQVGAILGRPVEVAAPIEVRQLVNIGACRPEWILRWSATLERFTGSPGPLHTRSKRFDSLKDNPEKIAAMLAEIGDYEALSHNLDADWRHDQDAAGAWLEDYWRVLDESAAGATPGPDLILEARQDALDEDDAAPEDRGSATVAADTEPPWAAARARSVSLPPGYLAAAGAAEDGAGWSARLLAADTLPVRLAVYLKLLGATDDSYPGEWRDPATDALPTMAQLAALDDISLPTLRKRRDAAIARLRAASGNGRME